MKHLLTGIITASLAAISLNADAGGRSTQPLLVQTYADGSGVIYGALSNTHNSSDRTSQLYCAVFADAGFPDREALCFADNSVNQLLCSTQDPALVETASRISSDAMVTIRIDNEARCTSISVELTSATPPKVL